MILNGNNYHQLTEREYESLSDAYENSEIIILNQRSIHDTYLSFQEREVKIPERQVSLLEFIMKNPSGVSRDEIIERRYLHSINAQNTLTQNIRRLSSRLAELERTQGLIETTDNGYRWNNDHEYRMFKHNRDVSSDLLLD